MKLQFLGAVRQVTGSQYYVEADGARLLVDCGMYQERQYLARNWEPSLVKVRDLDAVLLTHAHLDHCGLAPKLVQEGLRCPIITTDASADLAAVVLRDSAEIQEEDAAFKRKRHRKEGRKGKYPVKPLYTMREVDRALPLLQPEPYGRPVHINSGVTATFHDAGHILGSAMIELESRHNGQTRRLIFSGDVGRWDRPIIRDPSIFTQADYVVMESTYGNRDHNGPGDVEQRLAEAVNQTVSGGGKVIIPIFAIERAQELIFHFSRLVRDGRLPSVPVFLDSPMAAEVNEVFRDHRDLFDDETARMIAAGHSPLTFPGLKIVRTVEESKNLNDLKGPAIIMSTSGMCNAGRIKHHLAHHIGDPACTVLFVGYQAQGTLGRQIIDGNKEVRIHGRSLLVRAKVTEIQGFSGHADRSALLRWLGYFQQPPKRLFLTHGEAAESLALAERVRNDMQWNVTVPEYRQVVGLE